MNDKANTTEGFDDLNRHSEDIQEIITKMPSWFLKWGIVIVSGMLLIFICLAASISYPDKVSLEMKIYSSNVNGTVIMPAAGSISKVWTAKGTQVKKGQPMLTIVIESGLVDTILAPTDGRVNFIAVLKEGESLQKNQELFRIHPAGEHFYGEIALPAKYATLVKEGEIITAIVHPKKVNDAFEINGKIDFLADEPNLSGIYMARAEILSDKINKDLDVGRFSYAIVNILTKNSSILDRIYSKTLKK